MKKSSRKQLALKNMKKLKHETFLIITKAYKSKEKFFSANRTYRSSQNNRQAIIAKETCLKKQKKPRKIAKKKIRKIVRIFAIFCHISQQKNDSYPKLPINITKQLEQLFWKLNLHKKSRNRNGIQKQIQQKNYKN